MPPSHGLDVLRIRGTQRDAFHAHPGCMPDRPARLIGGESRPVSETERVGDPFPNGQSDRLADWTAQPDASKTEERDIEVGNWV